MSRTIFLAVALLAGALLPVQAALNAKMGRIINNPVNAAFISFVLGTVVLFFYLVITRQSFQSLSVARQAPWYVWLGGLLGTFYVVASIVVLPRIGVALTFGLVILGQLIASLVMDHYGLFGVEVKAVNFYRVLGVMLIISGVVLVRKF